MGSGPLDKSMVDKIVLVPSGEGRQGNLGVTKGMYVNGKILVGGTGRINSWRARRNVPAMYQGKKSQVCSSESWYRVVWVTYSARQAL